MPFDEVETFTKTNQPPAAKVTYLRGGHSDTKKATERKPSLVITVPTTICGVGKAEKFALLIGTGADAGKIVIRGMAKGTEKPAHIKPTEHQYYFKFNFGFVPRLGEDVFDGGHVPIRKIKDDEFELTVPKSWFEAE